MVADDQCFTGLDAYQQLLQTDVNYVILATPPGFRRFHIEAAVKAGKHVFAEKPVCVDSAGAATASLSRTRSPAAARAWPQARNTGKTVTWDDALNSPESLMPAQLTWGPMLTPPVAIPGLS